MMVTVKRIDVPRPCEVSRFRLRTGLSARTRRIRLHPHQHAKTSRTRWVDPFPGARINLPSAEDHLVARRDRKNKRYFIFDFALSFLKELVIDQGEGLWHFVPAQFKASQWFSSVVPNALKNSLKDRNS
jgi:hypothetical protein